MQERLRKGDTFQKVLPSKNSTTINKHLLKNYILDAAKETLFPALMYQGDAAPGNNVSGKWQQ
jgi:hypothetical protein